MTSKTTPTRRPGLSDLSQEEARAHTLIVTVEEKPGSVDRVVGVLRRRRANLQTFVLGRSDAPNVVRITAVVNDSEVGVDQLVEQLRKIIDVHKAERAQAEQAVARELALIKVSSTPAALPQVLEQAQFFGAHAVDVTAESITLEVTGSEEKVDSLVQRLQPFGIREIARTGRIAMLRGNNQ